MADTKTKGTIINEYPDRKKSDIHGDTRYLPRKGTFYEKEKRATRWNPYQGG